MPLLNSTAGEKVRWHVLSAGGPEAAHSFHWHGNTFLHEGRRLDSINLLGMATSSLDMSNDAVGTWVLHCHVRERRRQRRCVGEGGASAAVGGRGRSARRVRAGWLAQGSHAVRGGWPRG